jgi:hypothetical protein
VISLLVKQERKTMRHLFRVFLVLAWLVVAAITWLAVRDFGMVAGDVFLADLKSLSWRAQFNADFLLMLIGVGLWVAWRHRFHPVGWCLGLLCVLGGNLFIAPYLLGALWRAKGDVAQMLLGAAGAQSKA